MYAVIKYVNGAFTVDSEWNDLDKAIYKFHSVCGALWNDSAKVTADVMLINERLETVNGYHDIISHEAKA